MHVRIDQAGQDDHAFDVEPPAGPGKTAMGGDLDNAPVADADIRKPRAGWRDDQAAAEYRGQLHRPSSGHQCRFPRPLSRACRRMVSSWICDVPS